MIRRRLCRLDTAGFERFGQLPAQPLTRVAQLLLQ
jgi:hypothetical protein